MWCVAQLDKEYIRRMEDLLALYEQPRRGRQPVVCLDERPVPLRAEVREPIPATPGRVARQDSEYERRGTANVFCAVEPKAGRHFTYATPNRSAAEFAKIVRRLVDHYRQARTIHLVMDNLNTHARKALTEFYGEQPGSALWKRITPHYTPRHGSWLNQAELEVSLFARQCLGQRRIADLRTLTREARAWNRGANRDRIVIDWNFDRIAARKVFRYEKHQINRTEH